MSDTITHTRTRIGGVTVTDLPSVLGIPDLRDHQVQAIEAVTNGQDVLVVAPTGGGKTAGFLGAGLIMGGVTLVVSPLRSLIADQFRRLTALGLSVRIWNSDVKDAYKAETIDLLNSGTWEGFLYTTPESLRGRELSLALQERVTLAVVDEAHCVLKERGYRVSYGWLGSTLARIKPSRLYACTATLPPADREDLIRSLGLYEPRLINVPVARSNLDIHIVKRASEMLTDILRDHDGEPGIIFAATVATAGKIHEALRGQGWRAGLYHGRLVPKMKKTAQADFMSGAVPVMIATDAFLLGIDKPDIRFIVHYDYAKSIEDWVQGFGRAGRDDLPADVFGCFDGGEGLSSRRFLIRSAYPALDDIEQVWNYLTRVSFADASQSDIAVKAIGPPAKYSGAAIMTALLRHGLADALPHPSDGRRRLYRARGRFADVSWGGYQNDRREAFQRFDDLCELAELPDDQIATRIDAYFGAEGDHA